MLCHGISQLRWRYRGRLRCLVRPGLPLCQGIVEVVGAGICSPAVARRCISGGHMRCPLAEISVEPSFCSSVVVCAVESYTHPLMHPTVCSSACRAGRASRQCGQERGWGSLRGRLGLWAPHCQANAAGQSARLIVPRAWRAKFLAAAGLARSLLDRIRGDRGARRCGVAPKTA